jgi:hypothetical protein
LTHKTWTQLVQSARLAWNPYMCSQNFSYITRTPTFSLGSRLGVETAQNFPIFSIEIRDSLRQIGKCPKLIFRRVTTSVSYSTF